MFRTESLWIMTGGVARNPRHTCLFAQWRRGPQAWGTWAGLGPNRRNCALSGGQQAELVAIGIGHHDPADLPLADVDPSRPEGDETLDLRLLVAVRRWSEVEVEPVLPKLRVHRRTAPRDLRTATR